MAKYKCINKDCSEFDKIVTANTHIVYKKSGPVDKAAPCPQCGKIREMVDDGLPKSVLTRGNLNIYNGPKKHKL